MNETTYQLLIAAFEGETAGVAAVGSLTGSFGRHQADLPAAASIVKNAAGQLTIAETTDIGAKHGAAAGALAGGLIGLLSRKRGTVSSAALGALLGGVAAHKIDTGIPDPRLEAIGASLDHASSAAVLVVSEELDELFEISDRLHVIAKGRLSPSIDRADATVERIGEWMSGLWDDAAHHYNKNEESAHAAA